MNALALAYVSGFATALALFAGRIWYRRSIQVIEASPMFKLMVEQVMLTPNDIVWMSLRPDTVDRYQTLFRRMAELLNRFDNSLEVRAAVMLGGYLTVLLNNPERVSRGVRSINIPIDVPEELRLIQEALRQGGWTSVVRRRSNGSVLLIRSTSPVDGSCNGWYGMRQPALTALVILTRMRKSRHRSHVAEYRGLGEHRVPLLEAQLDLAMVLLGLSDEALCEGPAEAVHAVGRRLEEIVRCRRRPDPQSCVSHALRAMRVALVTTFEVGNG